MAVETIKKQEVLMRANYKKNERALKSSNNRFIDFSKKDTTEISSLKKVEANQASEIKDETDQQSKNADEIKDDFKKENDQYHAATKL